MHEAASGCAGRPFWIAWTQVGCAMIGRGELGFVIAKEALDDGLLSSRAYCATVWALLLATLLGPIAFRLSLRLSPAIKTATSCAQVIGESTAASSTSAAPAEVEIKSA
mmetsp:Transcript_44881/g.117740  ORF Transcript_44881/g.117740 Transcript_44881/m.117740 type:complete len:109 (-) Transcript_44881:167-493(-)